MTKVEGIQEGSGPKKKKKWKGELRKIDIRQNRKEVESLRCCKMEGTQRKVRGGEMTFFLKLYDL